MPRSLPEKFWSTPQGESEIEGIIVLLKFGVEYLVFFFRGLFL